MELQATLNVPFDRADRLDQLLGRASKRQLRAPFGVYAFDSSVPALVELALATETELFTTEFGVSQADLVAEYWGYNDVSVWLLAIDHRNRSVTGVIRLIRPSALGLASITDITHEPWSIPLHQVMASSKLPTDLSRVWDIAILAVYAQYRRRALKGSQISFALYCGIFRVVAREHISHLVGIMVDPLLARLQKLARPFETYAGIPSRVHVGAASTPVYMNVAEYRARLRRQIPALYALVIRGWGWFGQVAFIDCYGTGL